MERLRQIELRGDPETMGHSFGRRLQPEIEKLYEKRLDNALAQARKLGNPHASERELLDVAAACGAWGRGDGGTLEEGADMDCHPLIPSLPHPLAGVHYSCCACQRR